MGNNRLKYTFFVICILLFGCQKKDNQSTENVYTTLDIQNGDVIYRLGNGFFSDYFRETSLQEKKYSHAGIVEKDLSGNLFVIHSEASELTGIGGIKKEPLFVFLKEVEVWGTFRLDTTASVRDSLVCYSTKYLDDKIEFDLDFDNNSDDKIYCTELIAISINKALKREAIIARGKLRKISYYSIDDTYQIEEMKPILRFEP